MTSSTTSSTCMICLSDQIRVPCFYKESCFGCKKESGRPSCHSIQRYCLLCIQRHLQFAIPKQERVKKVKCPLCPATTDPRKLHAEIAYEPDYRMMSDDPAIYPCFHSEAGCDFVGSQMELHQHTTTCAFWTMSCDHCHQYFQKRKEADHIAVCPEMVDCGVPGCNDRIRIQAVQLHRIQVHRQRMCTQCFDWVEEANYQEHLESSCTHRLIPCRHCYQHPRYKDRDAHLQMHLSEIGTSMELMTREMTTLRIRMDRIMEDMRN